MKTTIENKSVNSENNINIVYAKYYKTVYNRIVSKIGYSKKEVVEELTNNVFISVNRYLNDVDSFTCTLLTLLFKLANNEIIDYYRLVNTNNNKKTVQISSYIDNEGNEFFQIADQSTDTNELNNVNEIFDAINSLTNQNYKTVLELRYVKGCKYKEIADLMNVSIECVKQYLIRAKLALKSELECIIA